MNKSQRSKILAVLIAVAAASGFSASASAFEVSNEEMGQLLGGVVGGALGNSIGGGNGKTAATIGGALLGAYYGGKLGANYNTTPQYGSTTSATPVWGSTPSPYAAAPAQPYVNTPVADEDDPSAQRQAQIDQRINGFDQRIHAAVQDGNLDQWQARRYHHQVSYVRFNERHALHDYGYLSAASQTDLNRQLDQIGAHLQNDLTVAWQ